MKFLFLVLIILGCQRDQKISSCNVTDPFKNVKYVTSYDGDTITIDLPDIPNVFGDKIKVRVRHIDTPEIKGSTNCEKDMAQKAKAATTNLLKNADRIDLENVGRDKYFRLLADVIVYKKGVKLSVGEYLLSKKYAVPYEGDTKLKIDWCLNPR